MSTSANPVTSRYYPRLSEVISAEDLPEFLHFAETGLDALLDSIHYKNLQYSKSARGDASFYSLDIVGKNIGIDLPFGLRFVLNPDDAGDSSISSFPVSLQYQWQILAFLRSFNLPGFSYAPDGFYALGLQVFRISDTQVIANTLNFFVTPGTDTITVYQQLVDDINIAYPGANLTLPTGQTPTVSMLADLITENAHIPQSVSEVMFGIYISDTDPSVTKTKLQQFFNIAVPDGLENYIRNLLVPQIKASLTLSAGIEFPTTMLQPVTADGTVIPNIKTVFKFIEATFYVDTQAGIGTQIELGGSLIPQYSQIANTGLIISFTNAKLDLSRTTNIPEADAAGYPVDFMGLYVQQASITFAKFGADDTANTSTTIYARNFLIGTGGVSGTIGIDASSGSIYRKFGSFGVELDTFAITFRQNAITGCNISGMLTLPGSFNNGGSPAGIAINVNFKDSGDFSITAKPVGSFPSFTLPNVFTVSVRSLTIGEQNGLFFIAVAGTLDFIANIPVLGQVLPKGINIEKLVIWEDGHIEFDGGGLVVPKAFKLSIGPVKIEVSHLSLGSIIRNGRTYYYVGFDGMVNAGMAGIEAAGNGIKYYFTHDTGPFDQFLSIDGIEIDITVPGDVPESEATFILKGYLSMNNPDTHASSSNAATEYGGKVSFWMPRLNISGSAGMRMQPSVPAFIVDIGMELSNAIPLGGSLGIYGFRGLIGQHYVPSKSVVTSLPNPRDQASWWAYYKAPTEGIDIKKFAAEGGYSVGVGISIATDFDSGFIFSSKLFLLLGLPNVFLIEGQAGILRSRLGLLDHADPPFHALITISPDGFTADLEINYKLPDNGLILALHAGLDVAFPFNNASGWHINIGQETPASEQVQATVLKIFRGHAYLMISSQGIKAGAGVDYNFERSFGPFGFSLGAYIEMGGFISFKPIQIGGYLAAGGHVDVHAWKFHIGFDAGLSFAAEAPNPFRISGSIHLDLHTPWPLPDIHLELDLSITFNEDRGPLEQPISILDTPNPATNYTPAVATNILTNEVFPINWVPNYNPQFLAAPYIPSPLSTSWKYNYWLPNDVLNVTIPLDSFIDIELLKPVIPGSMLGGAENQLPDGYTEMIPPQRGASDQVQHQFSITGLEIYAWNTTANAWLPYNVYEGVTAIVSSNTGPDAVDLSQLKPGYWQFSEKNRYNKIRLLSQNMFSFMNGTTKSMFAMAARNFNPKDIFCYETIQKDNIVNWKAETEGTVYPQDAANDVQQLTFIFEGVTGSVHQEASYGNLSLLMDGNQGQVTILFPVPVAQIQLDFGDNRNQLTVDFVSRSYFPTTIGGSYFVQHILSSNMLTPAQQNLSVTYNSLNAPVDQVNLTFTPLNTPDYEGDLVIGGYYPLPLAATPTGMKGNIEMPKALMFSTWYDQSFTTAEVLAINYRGQAGVVAQWPLDSFYDSVGDLNGITAGSPDKVPGFYEGDSSQQQQLHNVYAFRANTDALYIPFTPSLKIENGSFAFEITAVFNPFITGISTLLYKIKQDPNGRKKGYALHLVQNTPANPFAVYTSAGTIPTFSVLLTCYDGLGNSTVTITDSYMLDCKTSKVSGVQYKRIFISVNRDSDMIDFYIDKVLKLSRDIPAELCVFTPVDIYTYLNQVTYVTQEQQRRISENQISHVGLLNEIQILSDTVNKTIQPVWRPNTIFAVKVTAVDTVGGSPPISAAPQVHVFGFATAGPVGHFHQQSAVYRKLAQTDQTNTFKLASLQFYIDYERSYPDAQGRYNLSKPVLYHDPQVKLFFTQPYVNAMYSNWDNYLGLTPVQSSLELQLVDASGNGQTQHLVWEAPQATLVNNTNYTSLPADQQMLYLFNQAASFGTCDPMPVPMLKLLHQATYHFTDLQPNKVYTAVFSSVYQIGAGTTDKVEVYKFSFLSSRYATFTDQASSYIRDATPGQERYAIYQQNVSFTPAYIENPLKLLINSDPSDDPTAVLQYSTSYERIVFGGLKLATPEQFAYTVIKLVINTNPDDPTDRKILGIMLYNPEPFNDPKLPADQLAGTIAMTMTLPDSTVLGPDQFITIYSRDNSGVFITNTAMDVPLGTMQLRFGYKVFNGTDYVEQDFYNGAGIAISAYF